MFTNSFTITEKYLKYEKFLKTLFNTLMVGMFIVDLIICLIYFEDYYNVIDNFKVIEDIEKYREMLITFNQIYIGILILLLIKDLYKYEKEQLPKCK